MLSFAFFGGKAESNSVSGMSEEGNMLHIWLMPASGFAVIRLKA